MEDAVLQRWDLCKVPALKARSTQQLSSLRAPRQSEERRGEGQMQSCLEASPSQLPDRLPPAYHGLCLPRSSRKPWVLLPASAQLWPGHQMATCNTSPVHCSVLSSHLPSPEPGFIVRGEMPPLNGNLSSNEASIKELQPTWSVLWLWATWEWKRSLAKLIFPAQRVWRGGAQRAPGGAGGPWWRPRIRLTENIQEE